MKCHLAPWIRTWTYWLGLCVVSPCFADDTVSFHDREHDRAIRDWTLDSDELHGRDRNGVPVRYILQDVRSLELSARIDSDRQQLCAVQLSNGDRMATRFVDMKEDQLQMQILGGDLAIPLEFVRQVHFDCPLTELPQLATHPTDDLLHLTNGDTVSGHVESIDNAHVVIQSAVQRFEISTEQVRGITFAQSLLEAVPYQARPTAGVCLRDGSVLTCDELLRASVDARLTARPVWATKDVLHLPVDSIQRVDFWPKTFRRVEVDDVSEAQGQSYFGVPLGDAWRTDSLGPLLMNGRVGTHGFAVRSQSTLKLTIPVGATQFRVHAGFCDAAEPVGHVQLRVLRDGEAAWEAELDALSGPSTRRCTIDVREKSTVELHVDFGKRADLGDWLLWNCPLFVFE